jgi:hypothetical protein
LFYDRRYEELADAEKAQKTWTAAARCRFGFSSLLLS